MGSDININALYGTFRTLGDGRSKVNGRFDPVSVGEVFCSSADKYVADKEASATFHKAGRRGRKHALKASGLVASWHPQRGEADARGRW